MDQVKVSDLYIPQHYPFRPIAALVERVMDILPTTHNQEPIDQQTLATNLIQWRHFDEPKFKGFALMVNASVSGPVVEVCDTPEEAKKKS